MKILIGNKQNYVDKTSMCSFELKQQWQLLLSMKEWSYNMEIHVDFFSECISTATSLKTGWFL